MPRQLGLHKLSAAPALPRQVAHARRRRRDRRDPWRQFWRVRRFKLVAREPARTRARTAETQEGNKLRACEMAAATQALLAASDDIVLGPMGEQLRVTDCGGGDTNSCMFTSMARALYDDTHHYLLLRVVATLELLHEAIGTVVSPPADVHGSDALCRHLQLVYWQHVDAARELGHMSEATTLEALATALQVRVWYGMAVGGGANRAWKWTCAGPLPGSAAATVFLAYNGTNHWSAAVPVSGEGAPLRGLGAQEVERCLLDVAARLYAVVERCGIDVIKVKFDDVMGHWATQGPHGTVAATWRATLRRHNLAIPDRVAVTAHLATAAGLGASADPDDDRPTLLLPTTGAVARQAPRSAFDMMMARNVKRTVCEEGDPREDAGREQDRSTELPREGSAQKRTKYGTTGLVVPECVSWAQLLKINSDPGSSAILVDDHAADLLRTCGQYQCSICSIRGQAKRYNIALHWGGHVKAGEAALRQPTLPSVVSQMTPSQARGKAADMFTAMALTAGITAHQLELLRPYVPLLVAAGKLPCRQTILRGGGRVDEFVRLLKRRLASAVAHRKVVLVVDGSSTDYDGGVKMVNVVCITAAEDAPMLLRCDLATVDSMDAAYYGALLLSVLTEYNIAHENVVGVCADNTSVMPKFIKDAGFIHIPCCAHVINLMISALAEGLQVHDIFGWRQYVGRSTARRKRMLDAGLNPHALDWPDTRFGYAVVAVKELCKRWDAYLRFAAANPPEDWERVKDAPGRNSYARLLRCMRSPALRLAAILVKRLCKTGYRLLQRSQADVADVEPTFFTDFKAWLGVLDSARQHPAAYVTSAAMKHGVALVASLEAPAGEDWTKLAQGLQAGVATARVKVRRHLATNRADKPDAFLDILERRFKWDIANADVLPKDDVSLFALVGPTVSPTFVGNYKSLQSLLERRDSRLPPRNNSIQFWRSLPAVYPVYTSLAREALGALSIPLSNAAVERTFSVLRSRSAFNRLHAGDRYVSNVMLLSCNQHMLQKIVRPEYADLCARLQVSVDARDVTDVPEDDTPDRPSAPPGGRRRGAAKRRRENLSAT